jgi:hypothetical protein
VKERCAYVYANTSLWRTLLLSRICNMKKQTYWLWKESISRLWHVYRLPTPPPWTRNTGFWNAVYLYCHASVTRHGVWIGNCIYWITYNSKLQINITVSRTYTHYKSLQHTLNLLGSSCLHKSLSGNGSQQCPLLPCSRPYRLATVSQLTTNSWPRLTLNSCLSTRLSPRYNLGTDSTENTASKESSIFACLFVAAETCSTSPYQAMAHATIPVCTEVYLPSAWTVGGILFLFGISQFIHNTALPSEYEHSSSKKISSGKKYSHIFLDTTRATLKTTRPTLLLLLRVYSLPR